MTRPGGNATAIAGGANGSVRLGRYHFKVATEPHELEQLHQLNYETFVREVAQYADDGGGRLVDKFHDKNTYFVALHDGQVVGMVSVHDTPPFSIASRLSDPSVLEGFPRPMEVRLLAVHPDHRHRSSVFGGLGLAVLRHAQQSGHSHLVISGIADRLRMYERLGFRPLGPPVPAGGTSFVPMVAFVERMPEHIETTAERVERKRVASVRAVSLSPGAAELSPPVAAALARPTLDHRGAEFSELFSDVRATLSDIAAGYDTALFCGSGTLANEVVATTLQADPRTVRGLVLVNGEFGRRLALQADRAGLSSETLGWTWGEPWDLEAVDQALSAGEVDWIWAVHLETSTGMLNDVEGLCRLAARHGVRVCLDCISSLGAVPLDFDRWGSVHLATGVANKSLGGVAGLSMVFVAPGALEGMGAARVPQYLDLPATLASQGPRFTVPSPLVAALGEALTSYRDEAARRRRYAHYEGLGRAVRPVLESLDLHPLVEPERSCPHVFTFAPPVGRSAEEVLRRCRDWGYTLGGRSGYLKQHGWLQISTMGSVGLETCAPLFERLRDWQRGGSDRTRSDADDGA